MPIFTCDYSLKNTTQTKTINKYYDLNSLNDHYITIIKILIIGTYSNIFITIVFHIIKQLII